MSPTPSLLHKCSARFPAAVPYKHRSIPPLPCPLSPCLPVCPLSLPLLALALSNHPPMGPHNPALTLTKCHVLHLQITPPDLANHSAEVRRAGDSCYQTSQVRPVGVFSQVHGQGSPHTRHASCVPSLSQGLDDFDRHHHPSEQTRPT